MRTRSLTENGNCGLPLRRYKERERVMATFESDLHLPVTCVDAADRFLGELKGVKDPERKRKIIGKEFISIFDDFAQELEHKLGRRPEFLVQGTLYPDVIESCPPPGSGRTHSHTIKSHHNVGGLPEDMRLKLIEPLKLLFKDEVPPFSPEQDGRHFSHWFSSKSPRCCSALTNPR